jgi:glycosyltransferase involved in cell wall biosynthesis
MRSAKQQTGSRMPALGIAALSGTPETAEHEVYRAPWNAKKRIGCFPQIAILTGGGDRPYALGLASTLISQGVGFDFIASDELDDPELRRSPLVNFLNLRKEMRSSASAVRKVARVLLYYWRLLVYAATAKPKLFHILWNNKFAVLDRTLLMLYYRALGKRVVLTVHNVNADWRDSTDTFLNRLTLRIQYHLCDHLFVHTEQMRRELRTHFAISKAKVSVIPFGINSTVPNTALTSSEARKRLGLVGSHKVVLFFGNIAPYKGLEYLVDALALLASRDPDYRLIIAGQPKNSEPYWNAIQRRLSEPELRARVVERIEYVPDVDTEIYFKATDVLVLPYVHIFQSGVLFLAYNFGLPVIASDVGSLRDDIVVGRTGFVCKPRDPIDLAKEIEKYFSSELYQKLALRRRDIQDYANQKYSWAKVGEITRTVYRNILAQSRKTLCESACDLQTSSRPGHSFSSRNRSTDK